MIVRNLIFIGLLLGTSYSTALRADDTTAQDTESPTFPSYVISFYQHVKDCYIDLRKRNPDKEGFSASLDYNYGFFGFSGIINDDSLQKSVEQAIQEASAEGDETLDLIYKTSKYAVAQNDWEMKGFLAELFDVEMYSKSRSWLPTWWRYTQRATQLGACVALAGTFHLNVQRRRWQQRYV